MIPDPKTSKGQPPAQAQRQQPSGAQAQATRPPLQTARAPSPNVIIPPFQQPAQAQPPATAIPSGVRVVEPLAEPAQLSFEEQLRAVLADFVATRDFPTNLTQVKKREKSFTDFVFATLFVCKSEVGITEFKDYKFFYSHMVFFFKELDYPNRELCDAISREREKLLRRSDDTKCVRKQRAQQFLKQLQRLTSENKLPADVYAKDEQRLSALLEEEETPELQARLYRAILKAVEAPAKKAVKIAMQMLVEPDDTLANFERQRRVEQTTDTCGKWIDSWISSFQRSAIDKRSFVSAIARTAHVRARNDVAEYDKLFAWVAAYLSMHGIPTTASEVANSITPQQQLRPQTMPDYQTGATPVESQPTTRGVEVTLDYSTQPAQSPAAQKPQARAPQQASNPPPQRQTAASLSPQASPPQQPAAQPRTPQSPVATQPTQASSHAFPFTSVVAATQPAVPVEIEIELPGVIVVDDAEVGGALETAFDALERTSLSTGPDLAKLKRIVAAVFQDQESTMRSGGARGLVEEAIEAIERAKLAGTTLDMVFKAIERVIPSTDKESLKKELRGDLPSFRARLEKIGSQS